MSAVLPAGDPVDPDALEAARQALEAGFPVGLPTDTVYVLAVDPFVPGASDRLFALKRRPRDLDLPVLVATVDQALSLVTALPEPARRLMERCWPGPLTLVLPRDPELAADLGEDDLTVGVRMSNHPVLMALCQLVGPLGVATAGIQGERELETAQEVAATFGEAVPVVLDGGRCAGLAATVVDATGEDPHLIREGRLPWSAALAAIGD
jgi:L-threonylcarbamoyladenylate synthase